MIDLSRRRGDIPEVMDDADLAPEIYLRCLTDLASVNRWTLTHRATLRWLRQVTRGFAPGAALRLLDVAYGDGDLLRTIHRWAIRAGFRPELAGVDLNPRSALVAAAATPPDMTIRWDTGDVFAYVPEQPPDFIVTSQFTHHLDDAQVADLLGWLEAHATRGWFVADLHRSLVAYYGFPLLAFVMRWHRIVRTDGRASIARAFRAAEWHRLVERAGVAEASVHWAVPFRYCVARAK